MDRTPQQWIGMRPDAVIAGSEAQVLHAITDARHDIIELLCRVNDLKSALRWCVENDGECLVDHPARLKEYQSLI